MAAIVSSLLCCCTNPPGECECTLTALSYAWTGSCQYDAYCGLCQPQAEGFPYEWWQSEATVIVAGSTAVWQVPVGFDICTGSGFRNSQYNSPQCGGSCPDPGDGLLSAPRDPCQDGYKTRVRFSGLAKDDTYWYMSVFCGTGAAIGHEFSVYYRKPIGGDACDMLGTYTPYLIEEPISQCGGLSGGWLVSNFSAGTVVVS